jgi:cyclic beta-1,2-glucan synthetase
MNPLDAEFGRRIAFFQVKGKPTSYTADRGEFIGRNGTLEKPGALFREQTLTGALGAAMDPCAAIQTEITIAPGATEEVVFFLGQAETREAARDILRRTNNADFDQVLVETAEKWEKILGTIQVRTPNRAMDLLLNGWLLYQTLACRFWARAALYQAGGAIGFRDQLQDTMAFTASEPKLAHDHILKVAARQFVQGDVQHWWHPPTGRGVRTHFRMIFYGFHMFCFII